MTIEILRTVAASHPLLRQVPRSLRLGAARGVAVCPAYAFIYLRIPKAANSTIVRTLAIHAYPDQAERFLADRTGNLAKAAFSTLPAAGGLTATTLARRYRLVGFFRNPYTRVLSAYLDKMRSPNHVQYMWVARTTAAQTPQALSFADFIAFLETGGLHADPHWAPQTTLCLLPVDQLDYTGTVENLELDLQRTVEGLFGPESWQDMATREHNRQHANDHLREYYTDEIAERVYALYRKDFERLGYERRLPGMAL